VAVRGIVLYTDNRAVLRKKSKMVKRVDRRIKKLIRDLKDTLARHSQGIGLAAPQIGCHSRVVVVRLGGGAENTIEPGPPVPLLNPKIIEAGDEKKDFDGCLSFPDLYGETVRPHYLKVSGWEESGKPFDWVFEGFDAVVVHHEMDHLEGVLFIDRVEKKSDLYRVCRDEKANWVRVPVAANESDNLVTPDGNRLLVR